MFPLSTNLPIEVAGFIEYLPQIGVEIATEHYRHQSFYYNIVIVTLQLIEFASADINYSFYVRRIAVWKLQFLKPPKYLFSFYRLQTIWSPWSSQIFLYISFGLQ
jgi:hypothetical protein